MVIAYFLFVTCLSYNLIFLYFNCYYCNYILQIFILLTPFSCRGTSVRFQCDSVCGYVRRLYFSSCEAVRKEKKKKLEPWATLGINLASSVANAVQCFTPATEVVRIAPMFRPTEGISREALKHMAVECISEPIADEQACRKHVLFVPNCPRVRLVLLSKRDRDSSLALLYVRRII